MGMGEDVFSKLLSVKINTLPDIGIQRANFRRCARNRKPERGGLMDEAQKMVEENLFLHELLPFAWQNHKNSQLII